MRAHYAAEAGSRDTSRAARCVRSRPAVRCRDPLPRWKCSRAQPLERKCAWLLADSRCPTCLCAVMPLHARSCGRLTARAGATLRFCLLHALAPIVTRGRVRRSGPRAMHSMEERLRPGRASQSAQIEPAPISTVRPRSRYRAAAYLCQDARAARKAGTTCHGEAPGESSDESL